MKLAGKLESSGTFTVNPEYSFKSLKVFQDSSECLLKFVQAAVRAQAESLEIKIGLRSVEIVFDPESEVSADGRSWPAGSIVILREQPYGAHVKDLFEVQRYPEGKAPYDVAGWTLPILLGVHRVELMTLPEGELREVLSAPDAVARFAGDPRATGDTISSADSGAWSNR